MPHTNSVTKDSQTPVEVVEGVHVDDEVELARMGYKQELRCVTSQACPRLSKL